VFTPSLNTVKEDEIFDIIQDSSDEPDGVMVFGQIPGGEGNIFEKAEEGPGNGQGNGDLNLEPDNGRGNQVDAFLKGFENALL